MCGAKATRHLPAASGANLATLRASSVTVELYGLLRRVRGLYCPLVRASLYTPERRAGLGRGVEEDELRHDGVQRVEPLTLAGAERWQRRCAQLPPAIDR
eukprot:scaffold27562_cov65-Phaeocystis_antarctica.AAC.2